MNGRCYSKGPPKQKTEKASKCVGTKKVELVQAFPSKGRLAVNRNVPLPLLQKQLVEVSGKTYSYVLSTVKFNEKQAVFDQHGSAPNFQGGVLTLCTCKHQMRSRRSVNDWPGVWLAGFSSRTIFDEKHWLFYLAKIESAYESHADLWSDLNVSTRKVKAAHRNFLGDVYEPKQPWPNGKQRFSPSRYVKPERHAHRQHQQDTAWEKDIDYRHTVSANRAPLLVAEPNLTFLWQEPIIYLDQSHCRDFHKWKSLSDIVALLRARKS